MLQREVVEKMLAQPNDKNYGIPTVIFSWVTEMLGHFWVSPGSFNPPPKVDSGVVWFKRLAKPDFDPFSEKDLYVKAKKIMKSAFQTRRKMLRKALPQLKDEMLGTLRPQELSPADWAKLIRRIS